MSRKPETYNLYFAVIAYPDVEPEEYAEMVVVHLDWLKKKDIHLLIHASYKQHLTPQEINQWALEFAQKIQAQIIPERWEK